MALDRVPADGVVFRMAFDMPSQRAHYLLGGRMHHTHNHPGEQFPGLSLVRCFASGGACS
jgi:hypothetical protein